MFFVFPIMNVYPTYFTASNCCVFRGISELFFVFLLLYEFIYFCWNMTRDGKPMFLLYESNHSFT